MNAEFFALAFTAAPNPKLLALDLLLIENRRPRAMFLCVLLGGMTVALAIGLLDVLTVHADAISSQGKASAGVDLALGLGCCWPSAGCSPPAACTAGSGHQSRQAPSRRRGRRRRTAGQPGRCRAGAAPGGRRCDPALGWTGDLVPAPAGEATTALP